MVYTWYLVAERKVVPCAHMLGDNWRRYWDLLRHPAARINLTMIVERQLQCRRSPRGLLWNGAKVQVDGLTIADVVGL